MKLWESIKALFILQPQRLPRPYSGRAVDENIWRVKYGPDFPIADKMLHIFCESFDFDDSDRLRFRPDDKVTDIYACLYPSRFCEDSLEPNRLIEGLEREFSVSFDNTDNRLDKIVSFDQIIKEIKDAQSFGVYALPRAAQG